MEINLRLYKAVIPSIRMIIANNPNLNDNELVGVASLSTGAHIIACAYYLAHIKKMTPEIQEHIKVLKKFYKVDTVLYVEEFV